MPDLAATLERLRTRDWYSGQVVHVAELGSRPPACAEPDPPLAGPLRRYLDRAGIDRLYTHQVELLAAARRGEHAIVTTATSSGKTLGFNLPVFESMLADARATALYLYPMKAVTRDQLKVLVEMEAAAGSRFGPAVYDGDTSRDQRPRIRRAARIILSNPYELHQVLPWHHQWSRFLGSLRWVVIDEAHRYRGVFGSNVAQLLRRLDRICRLHGSRPQFILSSASIANPGELAGRLTGRDFRHIGGDGSPRGPSRIIFWNPLLDPATSLHVQAQRLVALFAEAGFQTLCFVRSRRLAELIGRWIRDENPDLDVSSYRAGYLPKERRAIESALSAGALRGVVSTDALELGIDIGGLDTIIIAGFPGTLASFWQQAGRAGRKLQESVIVFMGYDDPLDQYLLRHPERVMAREFESAVIDLANPHLLRDHLLCAASEAPVRDEEVRPGERRLLEELEQELLVGRTAAGWIYTGRDRPQERVALDRIAEPSIELLCDGRLLETIDRGRALREAHDGAVLMHRGETYVVRRLDLEARRAELERRPVDYYTEAVKQERLDLLETTAEGELLPGCTLGVGRLRATETYTGYRVRRYDRTLTTIPLDLPPLDFPTVGLWLRFSADLARELEGRHGDLTGGLHGTEHALIALAPLVAMCDRQDIGGATYRYFPPTGAPTVFIYDGYENGIGIAEKLHVEFGRLVGVTLELVSQCGCDDGCPACVLSARCGDGNQPMDKAAAVGILRLLADGLAGTGGRPAG